MRSKLLETVRGFYVNSRVCVRVDGLKGRKFEVNVGLRQGCVMSP